MNEDGNTKLGHAHPVTILVDKISKIFTGMGFDIADGRELEREWYNFDALNVPKDHPSRDMQDTFFLKLKEDEIGGKAVLRTHTSSVQIRYMTEKMQELKSGEKTENEIFPIAIVCPGKVFRNEATDATHEAQFHQVEGLLVGENISMGNLKAVLEKFFSDFFEKDIKVQLRSSFFPFVEPGLEVAMQCFKCTGHGEECNICKRSGLIEIMGAGMVHPKVLENCGIDSRKYSGFAFGGGIDRLAMLKYGLNDIRFLYNGDLRVVNQF
jgi:phenylalanyl-tRNA synthetase alpha chain